MTAAPALLPQHQELLTDSGITAEVAAARGYFSANTKAELKRLGFSELQRRTPALVIPIWDVFGQIATYQIRADAPRVNDRGRPVKYEIPRSSRTVLDVPPTQRDRLNNPAVPLFITEGVRKADSAASIGLCGIDVLGVWNWRGRNEHGGKTALPDFEQIAFNERKVYLVFDSDVMTKPDVYGSLTRFKPLLEKRDAEVFAVYLPPNADGSKVGLDDFLATGKAIADLLALASPELRRFPDDQEETGPYISTPAGIVHRKPTQNGTVDQSLTNFNARITEEVFADDGATERAEFVIEGDLSGEPFGPIRVSPRRFASMDWPYDLGARYRVSAGMGVKDRAREAIQCLSPEIERRHVYEHPGWRNLPGHGWGYLHAGGAIGAEGAIPGVDVALRGEAGRILLPDPPTGTDLQDAVRACLSLLDLAPVAITAPLFGAVYRALLCELVPADVFVFLVGPTGVFKTEAAALAMQHVGADFDRLHLPAQWSSTANYLERVAFDFKDAPLVVDDFAPAGSATDVARLHATADRLLRGVGNRGGRGRMTADGGVRPNLPPRGIVIGTGEDAPRGQSLRARGMILEVAPGDVDRKKLTAAQDAARRGVFVAGLAGFLQHLAAQFDTLSVSLTDQLATFRAAAHGQTMHARTPDAVAHLALGWWAFLRFAAASGVLTNDAAQATFNRVWAALGEAASQQASHQASEEPARRFLDLLASAIAAGHAHVAAADGRVPEHPEAWGWREAMIGAGESVRYEWQSQGTRAGWVDGDALYLDLDAALSAAQRVSQATGGGIAIASKTLAKRLHERGYLRATEQDHGNLKVRRELEGRRRRVLHLATDAITPEESDQSGQSVQAETESAPSRGIASGNGLIFWPDSDHADPGSGREIRPETAAPRTDGLNGLIGLDFPT
jgi:hypothetical protein